MGIVCLRLLFGYVGVYTDIANKQAALEVPSRGRGGRPKGSGKRGADGEVKNSTPRITLRMGKTSGDASGHSITAARSIAPSTGPLDRGTPPGAGGGYRSRPLTSHQLAVQQNRKDRAEYLINRKLKRLDRKSRKARLQEGAISRCWRRIKHMEDPFAKSDDEHEIHPIKPIIRSTPVVAAPPAAAVETDDAGNTTTVASTENSRLTDPRDPAGVANSTADSPTEPMDVEPDLPPVKKIKTEHVNEHHSSKRYGNGTAHRGIAGLAPTDAEEDDYGEEALALAAAIRRSKRRLERWEEEDARRALGEDVVVDRRGGMAEDSEEDGDAEGDGEGEMDAEADEVEVEVEVEAEGDVEGDAEGEEDGEGEDEEADDGDVEME